MGHSGDMIVALNRLPAMPELPEGVELKRAMALDKTAIFTYIRETFSQMWVDEASTSMASCPSHCVLAVKDEKIIGFACWDATAKGFLGPIGVSAECRGTGVGTALLLRTLAYMRDDGYAYGIIGWVDDARAFYERTIGAVYIPGGEPRNSAYSQMIRKI